MSKKEKKKYSLWSNYRFVYSMAWKTNKKAVFYPMLRAVLEMATALLAVALPAMVIFCLEKKLAFHQIVIVLGSCFLLSGILNGIRVYIRQVGADVNTYTRSAGPIPKIIEKTMNIDYEMVETEEVAQLKEKAFVSCLGNNQGFENFLHVNAELLKGIVGLAVYVLLLTTVQPLLVFVLFVISFLQLMIFGRVRKYVLSHRDEKAKQGRFFEYFSRVAFEKAEGKDIRLFSLRGWLMQIYEHQMENLGMLVTKERFAYFLYDLLGLGLQLFRDIACYGYLIQQIQRGMDISEFMIYLGVVSGFSSWFTIIFESVGQIWLDAAKVGDLQEWLNLKDTNWTEQGERIEDVDKVPDIVFDHVSYRYPGTEKMALKDISFHVAAGEKIALVGVNGAGKSTLVKLLCGLYTPTEGRILINGKELTQLDREEYQRMIAPVFQDSVHLTFTLAENVAADVLSKIDSVKCEKAMGAAGLSEKIKQLPNGIFTYIDRFIDPDGIELSGGEKQKLMLARALYKQAKLVMLDEPTAAMDSIAEAETYKLYENVLQSQTVFFISHRLASTRFCDRILMLEDGSIVEEGTHDSLLEKKGLYAQMYEVQRQYYQKEGVSA